MTSQSNQEAIQEDFVCRHCTAQYVVRYIELPVADSDSVYCVVCRRRMNQWHSRLRPVYRLVRRPEPAPRIRVGGERSD